MWLSNSSYRRRARCSASFHRLTMGSTCPSEEEEGEEEEEAEEANCSCSWYWARQRAATSMRSFSWRMMEAYFVLFNSYAQSEYVFSVSKKLVTKSSHESAFSKYTGSNWVGLGLAGSYMDSEYTAHDMGLCFW